MADNTGRPYIIGIAGGSASGKTTLSDRLFNSLPQLKVLLIHMDSYFKPDSERPHVAAHVTGIKYIDNNHPTSMNLPKLKADLDIIIGKNEYDVIIVEGLMTLYDDAICSLLELKLFVECRPDERIVRRLKRNMEWGEGFDEVANVYLDMVRYRHDEYVESSKWRADIIMNGSNFSEAALKMIADSVKVRCKK